MIKCIIIDDQPDALELLVSHARNYVELVILKTFTNPLVALSFLEKNKVDLIFTDVEMPQLNGLEFIETLRNKYGNATPYIIFTTGFDGYALPGFEQGVVDYLLKPIGNKRFKIAMDRFLSRYTPQEKEHSGKTDYFFADVNNKKQKINFKVISYIESAGNYVVIYGDNNLKAVLHTSMNALQELMPADNFIRIHKSFIISIDHIHAIKGREIMMNKSQEIVNLPIGVTFKSYTLKRLRIKE